MYIVFAVACYLAGWVVVAMHYGEGGLTIYLAATFFVVACKLVNKAFGK
jgi:hypothetical protein